MELGVVGFPGQGFTFGVRGLEFWRRRICEPNTKLQTRNGKPLTGKPHDSSPEPRAVATPSL